jgi:uncharacterized protein YyaL (SSP411 family)
VPSGNSIAALVLLKLGRLTMQQRFIRQSEQVFDMFSGQLTHSSETLCAMLIALNFWFGPSQEIIIAGNPNNFDMKEMLKLVRGRFLPNTSLLFHNTDEKDTGPANEISFLKEYTSINGKATAYVCENYVCRNPVNNIDDLRRILLNNSQEK